MESTIMYKKVTQRDDEATKPISYTNHIGLT